MPPVVSDAGPLHYLVLIDAIDSLALLFGRVLIPDAVATELHHPATPAKVRAWLDEAPFWLERGPASKASEPPLTRGAGERAAIELARLVDARLLVIDDRSGRDAAIACGLATTGTLGVLIRAAQLGHVDLASSVARLRATNFRCRPQLLDAVLAAYDR